jgi:hypothetical protein
MDRQMCPLTTRLLLEMYTRQEMVVGGVAPFQAVLSSILFCVYVDKLLSQLQESEAGCYIGHRFAGALGYADDVTLIAPSVSGMKKMLSICEDFTS